MNIHRVTKAGRERFREFLTNQKTDQPEPFPQSLLTASHYAEEIGGDTAWLDALNLDDSFETAKSLDHIVSSLGLTSAERDWGFWTWCSAYLFQRLCKVKDNKMRPGELPIWIAEPENWQRYYRHYLASIWTVYAAHVDKTDELVVLLNGPVNTPGELWAQIASRQELITNGAMIDVVYNLFWDKEKDKRKHGAGGSSPRRLTKVLRQFERTYDLSGMTGQQIIDLLPSEFDRFLN